MRTAAITVITILLAVGTILFLEHFGKGDLEQGAVTLIVIFYAAIAVIAVGVARRYFPVLIFMVGFTGCAGVRSGEVIVAPTAPPVMPVSLPVSRMATVEQIFARENLPAGFLILATAPSSTTLPRYLAICDSFQRSLPPYEPGSSFGIGSIATYWPVQPDAFDAVGRGDCVRKVSRYNYSLAGAIAALTESTGFANTFLVGTADVGGRRQTVKIRLDGVATENMDSVFNVWRRRIVDDPTEWEAINRVGTASASLIDVLNRFGATIVTAIRPIGGR